jgi:hypothetical protein
MLVLQLEESRYARDSTQLEAWAWGRWISTLNVDRVTIDVISQSDLSPSDLIIYWDVANTFIALHNESSVALKERRKRNFRHSYRQKFGEFTNRILTIVWEASHFQLVEILLDTRLLYYYCSLGWQLKSDSLRGIDCFCKEFFPSIGSILKFKVDLCIILTEDYQAADPSAINQQWLRSI